MTDDEKYKIFVLGVIVGCAVGIFSCFLGDLQMRGSLRDSGYLQACKDFYDGKLKYELKELPGGEKQWIKKEK